MIKWFPDRPGLATGCAIMGFGGGALIGAPLAVTLMKHYSSAVDTGVARVNSRRVTARITKCTRRRSMAMTWGGLAAFIYASVVVWAVSLRLGRNSGAVLWVFVLFILAGAGKIHVLRDAYGTSSADWPVSTASLRH